MLPIATVHEIQHLLEEGQLSQRKIAAKLGVSRGTVGAIASGRRGLFGKEPEAEQPDVCALDLPPERCEGCGAMVYMPCVLCRSREYQRREATIKTLEMPQSMPRRVA